MTLEEYIRSRGLDPNVAQLSPEELAQVHEMDSSSDPALQALIDRRRAWRQVADARNEFLQKFEGGEFGYLTPEEVGIHNVQEGGKSNFASWDQQWQQMLASNPAAREFASSPHFKDFVSQYQNPFIAFQRWNGIRDLMARNHWNDVSGGQGNPVYYTGGPDPTKNTGAFYNYLGRPINGTPSFTAQGAQGAGTGVGYGGQGGGGVSAPMPSNPPDILSLLLQLGMSSSGIPGMAQAPGQAAGTSSAIKPADLTSIPNLLTSMSFNRLRAGAGYSPFDTNDITRLKGGGIAWGAGVPAWVRGWRPMKLGGGSSAPDTMEQAIQFKPLLNQAGPPAPPPPPTPLPPPINAPGQGPKQKNVEWM